MGQGPLPGLSAGVVLLVSGGYLALLFGIAALADRRAAAGRSVIASPWVYALSLGVYCSAWTYFGSVGRAATGGIWFLPIYLGPTLAMLLAWGVIRRMVRISRTYRVTSIADFVASRYGKSRGLAALVTAITVVGLLPYIALQLKAVATAYRLLTEGTAPAGAVGWWQDGALLVTLALAAFTLAFGTRHHDSAERHEGMVAAIAVESVVKLVAFLAVGAFVTWGLFAGPADIWARAADLPGVTDLLRLGGGAAGGFDAAQWAALTLLAGVSLLMLPRQFQMAVVECVDERHIRRASWAFPAYLLLINVFVLPIALGGLVYFGPGGADPETFVLSLPLAAGAPALALLAYLGGLSAATGMLIVETLAIATMVCNDLVMPALLARTRLATRAGGDLTPLLLGIRRVAIVAVLLLGYLYFRVAGEAYALVSIGLISFAAVAQVAPALLGGLYWRDGTRAGAMAGLAGGFALWVWTLMLPSVAKSGWIGAGFLLDGPFGISLLAPERLLGLGGLDPLTHALVWSLLVNVALYVGVSLRGEPSGRGASQALLFVDVFERGGGEAPVFWRGQARAEDLTALARRWLGPARAEAVLEAHRQETGALLPDARLVDRIERELAGVMGAASARVMVAAVVEEEPLGPRDVVEILDEASQVRAYARALEETGAELRAANEALKGLDQLKDDFISSVTHELRTPLTSIRALSELMLDTPDMTDAERAEFLRIIVAESERLGRLVNQVLDMAKLEAGHMDWAVVEVDLRALVAAAARASSELFRARGAVLAEDLPPAVPVIRGDPDRLTQVLLNLLSNAAKFVPEGRGRATVRLREEPEALVVEVTDNGPGIAEADQALVFERFRQAGDSLSRPQGTGLGLPISREIVEHHGGGMWLDSRPGGGATFGFRLPKTPRGGQDNGHEGADRG